MNHFDSQMKIGRPTVMTSIVIQKLRTAYTLGCSDREACFFAEIGRQTMYRFEKRNPDFRDQKEGWRMALILKARTVIIRAIENGNLELSWWYLSKKCPQEFGQSSTSKRVRP